MTALAAAEIVRAWELGAPLHAIDRALVLAAFAAPELDGDALARLSLGERDALLLTLHERTFGTRIEAIVECPACAAPLDLALEVKDLRVPAADVAPRLSFDEIELELRPLDSRDLAAIARAADGEDARQTLATRALVRARRGDEAITPAQLSPEQLTEVARHLERLDPQADLVLELACADCGREWPAPFDVAGFVWSEISVEARRLLQEVAALARAFSWSEHDILSMTSLRRQHYLELCDA